MSLTHGNLSLRRFIVHGPVPDVTTIMEGLRQDAFRPFEDGLESERMGWCDWRNLLICPPEEDFLEVDRFAILGLRIDTRAVPAMLLNAQVDFRLASLKKEKDLAFVGKEARISLQDEVKADLLRKVLPSPAVVEVGWDLKGGTLWTTASSGKGQSALTTFFMKSFGLELQPYCPLLLAARLVPEVSTDAFLALEPLMFATAEAEASPHGI